MSKDIFNEWYKSSFNKLNETPPVDVWDGISNELDVQDVWERVDEQLTVNTFRETLRRRLAWAASILLLIVAGVFIGNSLDDNKQVAEKSSPIFTSPSSFEIKQPSQQQNSKGDHSSNNTGNNKRNDHSSQPFAQGDNSKKHNGTTAALVSANDKNDDQNNTNNKAGSNSNKGLTASNNNSSTDPLSSASLLTPAEEPVVLSSITQNELPVESSSQQLVSAPIDLPEASYVNTYRPVSPGFSAGPLTALNTVWLLNRTTIAGLQNTALYQTDITLGAAFGISAVYDTKGKWGLQADVLHTRQGQKYHYYDEGAYASKEITADYYQLNTLARRKKASRFFNSSLAASRTWSFGTELRWLRALEVDVNKPTVITTNTVATLSRQKQEEQTTFSKLDYGVHAGFEYEVQLNSKLVVTSGLQAGIGLNNVNRGESGEPGKFNNTYNAAAGLHLGMRYMLSSN
jgi:hypothetical protein